jgi:transcriptional regulator with XRE-family HTH domain
MPLPNKLREFRKAQGLTQEQVAQALGLDGNAVSRHERGVVNPKPPTRDRYASLYGVAECLLWPDGPELPNVDEAVLSAGWTPRGTVRAATAISRSLDGGGGTVQRRSFLVLAGVAVTAPAHRWLVDEPEPLVAALNGDRVTPELAARLPPMIAELRRMDDAQGGPMVLSLAQREFAWVAELLDNGTYDEATGRALYRALAELGQLAAWLANDVGDTALAQRFGITAVRAAASAGDRALGAHALSSMAHQTAYAGHPSEALTMFDAVLTRSGELPGSVLARTQASAGYAHALLGDRHGCETAHGAALEALDREDPDDRPPYLYWLSERYIYETGGEAYLILGQPDRSVPMLQNGNVADTQYTRDSVIHLTWLARAQLSQGEIEASCDSAQRALNALDVIASPRAADFTRTLCDRMQPYTGNADVREVVERANELVSARV